MARQTKQPFRVDLSAVIKTMGLEWLLEHVGVQRLVEQLGTKRFIQQVGGVKQLLAELSPEQRRELKRLLQE